jgi:hypothetical protein
MTEAMTKNKVKLAEKYDLPLTAERNAYYEHDDREWQMEEYRNKYRKRKLTGPQ